MELVFDVSYNKIITSKDAWGIISQVDFESSTGDGGEMESRGVRPSYSALAVGELSDGIAGELDPTPSVNEY